MAADRQKPHGDSARFPLPLGIGVGIAIGSGIGAAMGKLAIGVALGVALGAALVLIVGTGGKKGSGD